MKHVPPPQGEPLNASILPSDITAQDLPVVIGRLRKEARDEIHRLIGFLDTTDDYVSRELEDQVDDGPCDDNELEPSLCGVTADPKILGHVCGDDLEGGDGGHEDDDEPSLGSGAASEWSNQVGWAMPGEGGIDAEDEHDGFEPEDEGGEAVHEDDEPTLGWTIEGQGGSVRAEADDCEVQDHLRVRPQARADLGAGVSAETSYRRFLCGLTPDQERAFREGMRAGRTSGVLVR